MYGTIMRAQVKPGQMDAFRRFNLEQGPPENTEGFVSLEFAVEDKNPNMMVGIIRFKDKESYVRNADAPRTNDNYLKMLNILEGPPEWIDIHFLGFMGEPLKEYMAAGAMPSS
jgi:quinol monooxygenase YgiN